MKKYLIFISLISTVASANLNIRVVSEFVDVPVDIIKITKTLNTMISDLGGYERYTKSQEPIYLSGLSATEFKKIISILQKAKESLASSDISTASDSELKKALEEIIKTRKNDEILGFLKIANFLNIKQLINAASNIWINKYLATSDNFHDLLDDIKEIIIKKIKPKQFMTLIKANQHEHPNEKQIKKEEASFKIALRQHYREKAPADRTSKQHYENLYLSNFVLIPGGSYEIGSAKNDEDHNDNEELHSVALSPFFIMDAPVNQEEFATLMGANRSYFKDAKYCPESFKEIMINGMSIGVCAEHPEEQVSWNDANDFAKKKSEQDALYNYSLPTEAQLEVALRGGVNEAYISGKDTEGLGDYVWYEENSNSQSHAVKSKKPNNFGVYNGSVSEWTKDWGDDDYMLTSGLDPQGPGESGWRVIRGCGWSYPSWFCRLAARSGGNPNEKNSHLGFRLVRTRK